MGQEYRKDRERGRGNFNSEFNHEPHEPHGQRIGILNRNVEEVEEGKRVLPFSL
jgi:hypothetical protein